MAYKIYKMKGLVIIGILAALGVAVFLGLQAGAPVAVVIPVKGSPAAGKHSTPSTMGSTPEAVPMGNPSPGAQEPDLAVASRPAPVGNAVTRLSGSQQVEAWLSSSTDIPTIANKILVGFSALESKDQLLAVSKLVALVSDDRFDGLKRLLFDPKTTIEAKEFLFRDALSRAESLKLPLLLAIMQMPEHPCADEAHETLKSQFGVDYGVNYGQWQAKISEVLRAQQ